MSAATSSVIEITKTNFQSVVLESQTPVFLDFWASWCMPCRMAKPEVEKLAVTLKDKVVVGAVNVDQEPELAEAFGVRGIPMFVLMNQGKVLDAMSGFAPAATMEQRITAKVTPAPSI